METATRRPSPTQMRALNTLFTKKNQKAKASTDEKIIDHILNFDPDDTTTALKMSSQQPEFMATKPALQIPWPAGHNPVPKPLAAAPDPENALPRADIIIVTWTVAEALALSDVLTPGHRSKTDWYHYKHNWSAFKPNIKRGAPSLQSDRLGSWFPTEINGKSVICFKSELHFARDGSKVPVKDLWLQLIAEVQPSLVITTGTAGGIGAKVQLGDVALTGEVRFDCKRTFKNAAFAQQTYTSTLTHPTVHAHSADLMKVTTPFLPHSSRTCKIVHKTNSTFKTIDVVTTDFFAFDDSTDFFGLQSLGLAVEMGDAVLGLACSTLPNAPKWLAIRNASDPEVDGTLPYHQQVELASRIYEKYGYWTTVNSAIACWSVI